MGFGDGGNSRSCDLVSLGSILRVCEVEMVLLEGRGPDAEVDSHVSGEAIFCSGEANFPFRGRFALPLDWCLIGYIHQTTEGSWCHGTALSSGMAFTVLPEGITEFVLCSGSEISLVLVPLERLRQKFAELEPYQAEIPVRLLSLFKPSQAARADELCAKFDLIRQHLAGDEALTDGQALQDVDVDALLASHLRAGLSALPDDRPRSSRGRRTHYLMLQRAERFMYANMRHEIYMSALCNAAGVSERALRYAFDDLLGISPMRYLTMLRLSTACRNLALSDANRRSVKSVALSCGLWDLSRFADSYRRVFGELPHETLMRAPSGEMTPPR